MKKVPSPVTSAALPWVEAALTRGDALAQVEADVLLAFTLANGLTPAAGSRVSAVVEAGRNDAARELLDAVPLLSLNDVVMVFETLVPEEEASLYGANFTPSPVTSFMSSEALDILAARRSLKGVRVLDAAVGCGALLVAALLELVARTGEVPHVVASRFTGVDISEDSVARAQILLDVACLALGDDVEPEPTLLVGDALASTTLTHANVLEGREFEIILMNPPYVRFQRLPHQVREELPRVYRTVGAGNFNLYFPFFEVAAHHVTADGVMAFITPNGFFTSKSAAPLRAWFAETGLLDDVVDFGHHRVFAAMTYTAVTFLTPKVERGGAASVRYSRVDGLAGLARIAGTSWRGDAASMSLPSSGAPWAAVENGQTADIAVIAGQPRTLTAIADIRYGIATCRDRIYLLNGAVDEDGFLTKTHNGVEFPIEVGVTAPCVRVSSLSNVSELEEATSRIIYPYRRVGSTVSVIPEEEMREQFPNTYAYFLAVKNELALRDKGKKDYPEWFAYARTQGLRPVSPKLLSPLYGDDPRFMLSENPDLLFLNGVAVTLKPDADLSLRDVAALLNSSVCRDYVHQVGVAINGGFHAYQKTQLSGFGVPAADNPLWEAVREADTAEGRDAAVRALYGL